MGLPGGKDRKGVGVDRARNPEAVETVRTKRLVQCLLIEMT